MMKDRYSPSDIQYVIDHYGKQTYKELATELGRTEKGIGNLIRRLKLNYQLDYEKAGNKSGVRGVTWKKELKKWEARVCVNKKMIYLGWFRTVEEAKRAIEDLELAVDIRKRQISKKRRANDKNPRS